MMNPWKGLSSYEETDDTIYKFKGRTKAANELYLQISNNLFCTLYGKMGCGKTSLLQAGIFPLFRLQSFLPVVIRLKEDDGSLADSLIKALETECKIREVSIDPNPKWGQRTGGQIDKGYKLWEFLYSNEFHDKDGNVVSPVIAIDQIEEAFNEHYEEACELLRQLYYLVSDDLRLPKDCNANFRVVVTIREDDLFLLEDAIGDGRYGVLKQNRYRLEPLTDKEAREVIALGEQFFEKGEEEAIAEKILALSKEGSAHVSTYMLSLICSQLFTSTNGHIALKDVQDSSTGLLQSFYEASIKHVNKDTKKYIETQLISGDRKTFIPLDEFKQKVDPADVKTLMEGEYKMVQEIKAGTTPCVELLHDSLAKAIKKYKDEEEERKRQEKEKQELIRQQEEELTRIAKEEEAARKRRVRRLTWAGVIVFLVIGSLLTTAAILKKLADDRRNQMYLERRDKEVIMEKFDSLGVDVSFKEDISVRKLWWEGELKVTAILDDGESEVLGNFAVNKTSKNNVYVPRKYKDGPLLLTLSFDTLYSQFRNDTILTKISELSDPKNNNCLQVRLKDSYLYGGTVLMSDSIGSRPIENAIVVMGNEITYTDAWGKFLFQLPDSINEDTEIFVFKRGFETIGNLKVSNFRSDQGKQFKGNISMRFDKNSSHYDSLSINYKEVKVLCERIDYVEDSIMKVKGFKPYGRGKNQISFPISYVGTEETTGMIHLFWIFEGPEEGMATIKGVYWYSGDKSDYKYHFITSGKSLKPSLNLTDSLRYRTFELKSRDIANNEEIIKGKYCTNKTKPWEFNIFVQSNKIAESATKK